MSMNKSDFFPTLPLRDIVVFPGMIVPLFVGRDKSIKALETVMSDDKKVFLIAQKDGSVEDPAENDLYRICKNFKPKNKNLRYLITDNAGKILKNSFDLKILLENTNWKKL